MKEKYEVYWLEKGTLLAERYEICDVISEGGFGIVYLGYDTVLKMNVAIKEYFPRRFATRGAGEKKLHVYKQSSSKRFQEGLGKFYEEARTMAKFHQLENIIMVRDFFYANNTAYIVSEHVTGVSVKEYVDNNGRMEPSLVLSIMKPILQSLKEIHTSGLLHQDIAPDNIILQGNKAVLIDFGSARFNYLEEDRSMTIFFKRGYSAEEQYVEEGKQGTYTDVYAICATMYYMLTGICPAESVQRRVRDVVLHLDKFKDIVMTRPMKDAIMKGMAVSKEKRYKTVNELYDNLYGEHPVARRRIKRGLVVCSVASAVFLAGIFVIKLQGEKDVLSRNKTYDSATASALREDRDYAEAQEIPAAPTPTATGDTKSIVPDFKGLSIKKARQKIKKLFADKLEISIKYKYHNKAKKGTVIRQSLSAGKITLYVSKGAKPVPTATPKPTKKPKKSEDEFAGELPW